MSFLTALLGAYGGFSQGRQQRNKDDREEQQQQQQYDLESRRLTDQEKDDSVRQQTDAANLTTAQAAAADAARVRSFQSGLKDAPAGLTPDLQIQYLRKRQTAAQAAGDQTTFDNTQAQINSILTGGVDASKNALNAAHIPLLQAQTIASRDLPARTREIAAGKTAEQVQVAQLNARSRETIASLSDQTKVELGNLNADTRMQVTNLAGSYRLRGIDANGRYHMEGISAEDATKMALGDLKSKTERIIASNRPVPGSATAPTGAMSWAIGSDGQPVQIQAPGYAPQVPQGAPTGYAPQSPGAGAAPAAAPGGFQYPSIDPATGHIVYTGGAPAAAAAPAPATHPSAAAAAAGAAPTPVAHLAAHPSAVHPPAAASADPKVMSAVADAQRALAAKQYQPADIPGILADEVKQQRITTQQATSVIQQLHLGAAAAPAAVLKKPGDVRPPPVVRANPATAKPALKPLPVAAPAPPPAPLTAAQKQANAVDLAQRVKELRYQNPAASLRDVQGWALHDQQVAQANQSREAANQSLLDPLVHGVAYALNLPGARGAPPSAQQAQAVDLQARAKTIAAANPRLPPADVLKIAMAQQAQANKPKVAPRPIASVPVPGGLAPLPVPGARGGSQVAPPFNDIVAYSARAFGVPVPLAMRLVQNESGGDANAVSNKGAVGVAQLMPGTAKEMGVTNSRDPVMNVYGGMRYLGQMLKKYGGNEILALAAYNAGPGAVDAARGNISLLPAETQDYVRKFIGAY